VNYLRSLFLNFLVVFFVDRVIPGIHVANFENVPDIGDDILFSFLVGFLNASIFFFFALLGLKITDAKLAIASFVISFGSFLLIALFPFGVQVLNAWGVIFGGAIVWGVSLLTNHLEWKHYQKNME
jgi:uncharacterized membrane protein YvlD (DUF360 family)